MSKLARITKSEQFDARTSDANHVRGDDQLCGCNSAKHDLEFLGTPGAPQDSVAALNCSIVQGMFALGPERLTEAALEELADHLDDCAACCAMFDRICPVAVSCDETTDSAAPARSEDREAQLVRNVLDDLAASRLQSKTVKLLPYPPLAARHRFPSDSDGQLARGQVLQGGTCRFVVEQRIGFGDFTETYAAKRVSEADGGQVKRRMRAVIKIPRIAYDMSSDAAADRFRLLRSLIRVHAQELQNLTGLREVAGFLDCGQYVHRLRDRPTDSTFVAYEFIDGVDLASYMALHYSVGGQFCGLATAVAFARWARMLTQGLLEIHNRLALHGDVCPRNVLVTPEGHPVFVDVGQSLFREVMNGAKAFGRNFYRAPEGIGTPSSDLFSLGGLLYFLATGQEPIGLAHADKEALKQQIVLKIKEANPRLYQDDAGVADVIAMCLRKEDRVQHAGQLLRDIDAFWPEAPTANVLDELKLLAEPAAAFAADNNTVFAGVAGSHIRSLHRLLVGMNKGVFDASGSATDIRSAASALLAALGAGDEFLTVSLPAFWHPDNIGINGRFLSRCRKAAADGAYIRRVFLIDEKDLSNPYIQKIVAAHLDAVADIDPSLRPNFSIRYVLMSAEERRRYVANGKHFGLLVKGNDRIAMWPVYDANDALVSLRFRSGPRQVEGLREAFDEIWSDARARPLVDLRLSSESLDLDLLEEAG